MVGGLLFWANAPLLWGWQPRVVLSGSMAPALAPGDVVLTEAVDDVAALPIGRVIAVDSPTNPSGTYLHRIVRLEGDGSVVTRGDANRSDDFPPVRASQVRGQVVSVVPLIGRPMLWLHAGQPLPLLGVAAATGSALWCAASALRRLGRADQPTTSAVMAATASPGEALSASPAADAVPASGPLDRGALLEVANAHYELGRRAHSRMQVGEAIRSFESALECYEHAQCRCGTAHCRYALGVLAGLQGRSDVASAHLSQALSTYTSLGDRLGEANTQHELGVMAVAGGRAEHATTHLLVALELYRDLGDERREAATRYELGRACQARGAVHAAVAQYRSALDQARSLGELTTAERAAEVLTALEPAVLLGAPC